LIGCALHDDHYPKGRISWKGFGFYSQMLNLTIDVTIDEAFMSKAKGKILFEWLRFT
jgi:hypothetical protein